MPQITKDQLSTQEQWWLGGKWPQYIDVVGHRNPNLEILKLLISKHLVIEKKDWLTNKPIFYLTQLGEQFKMEIRI